MITALTYLLVSVSLAVLLYFGAKEHHQVREGVEIFRFQSALVWAIFCVAPVWMLCGAFIYSTYPPGLPNGIQLYFLITMFTVPPVGYVLAYLYAKKFYIEIDDRCIRIGGLRQERSIPYGDIRKIVLVQGAKGSMELSLFDARDQRILKASNSLQDFMNLVDLIKEHTRDNEVLIKYRDKWGKWSRV